MNHTVEWVMVKHNDKQQKCVCTVCTSVCIYLCNSRFGLMSGANYCVTVYKASCPVLIQVSRKWVMGKYTFWDSSIFTTACWFSPKSFYRFSHKLLHERMNEWDGLNWKHFFLWSFIHGQFTDPAWSENIFDYSWQFHWFGRHL